jgi:hypothetical protein
MFTAFIGGKIAYSCRQRAYRLVLSMRDIAHMPHHKPPLQTPTTDAGWLADASVF